MTDSALVGPVAAPDLHVMSFNIRRRLAHLNPRSPDRWVRRRPLLKRLLAAEQPALIGVQEALFDQANFVRHALGTGQSDMAGKRTGEGKAARSSTIHVDCACWSGNRRHSPRHRRSRDRPRGATTLPASSLTRCFTTVLPASSSRP